MRACCSLLILMSRRPPPAPTTTQLRKQIVGMWTLVSVVYEDQETKARTPVLGEKPRGRQIATADGRWLALVTAEGRPVPKTDEQRAQALRTMISYSGRYRVEDGTRHHQGRDRLERGLGRRRADRASSASRATGCSSRARRCRTPMWAAGW